MPRAPEYTRKEQKQRNKELGREAQERGARQEFPGAPIWNDWLKAQHEIKKREIGFPRRLGRAAVETAAVSVLIAKGAPRAVIEHRRESSAQKAKRLQKI